MISFLSPVSPVYLTWYNLTQACVRPQTYTTPKSTYMTPPPPCTQESTINQGSYLVWCSDQILIAVCNQRLDMRIIIIIFKYKPIENAQSNGVDPQKKCVWSFVLTTRSRVSYSYYYYWSEEGNDCGVIFYCGWARRLNYMNGWKTSARCHSKCAATSPAESFMIYYINHCTAFTHTHTHTPRYAENTKQPRRAPDFRYSNPKNDLFFLANHLLHHKQRV